MKRKLSRLWFKLVSTAIFFLISTSVAQAAEAEEFMQQKSLEIERRYGLQNPGQPYPVTIFDPEKVPVPSGYEWDMSWIDPETAIYPATVPRKEGEPLLHPPKVEINTVNFKTGAVAKVTEGVNAGFCYDTDSQDFSIYDAYDYDKITHNTKIKLRHGKLGKKLTTVTTLAQPKDGHIKRYYECPSPQLLKKEKFIVDGVEMRKLPREHGYIGYVGLTEEGQHTQNAIPEKTYQFISPEGAKKRFSIPADSSKGTLLPTFVPSLNEYYLYHSQTFWRYDPNFNLISKMTFAKFPWAPGTHPDASKDGYLFYRAPTPSDKNGRLFLQTFDGKVIEVLKGFGFLGWLSVSPNGCRALFLSETIKQPPVTATVELCQSSH